MGFGQERIVKRLLDAQADPFVRDDLGRSAVNWLRFAEPPNSKALLKALYKRGVPMPLDKQSKMGLHSEVRGPLELHTQLASLMEDDHDLRNKKPSRASKRKQQNGGGGGGGPSP